MLVKGPSWSFTSPSTVLIRSTPRTIRSRSGRLLIQLTGQASMTEASASKKRRLESDAGPLKSQPRPCSSFTVTGLTLHNFHFKAPLDHSSSTGREIDIFVRLVEGTNKVHTKQPYLLYLQGKQEEGPLSHQILLTPSVISLKLESGILSRWTWIRSP